MADLSMDIDGFFKLVDATPTQGWIDKAKEFASKNTFTKAFHLVGLDPKDAKDALGGSLAEHGFLARAIAQATDLDEIARNLRRAPVPNVGIGNQGIQAAPTPFSPNRPGQLLQLLGPDASAMTVNIICLISSMDFVLQ